MSDPRILWQPAAPQPPCVPSVAPASAASVDEPRAFPYPIWTPSQGPGPVAMAFVPDAPAESMDTGTDTARTMAMGPDSPVTVINMQSRPDPFYCYECEDGNHEGCFGVPCCCECPFPAAAPPVSAVASECREGTAAALPVRAAR